MLSTVSKKRTELTLHSNQKHYHSCRRVYPPILSASASPLCRRKAVSTLFRVAGMEGGAFLDMDKLSH